MPHICYVERNFSADSLGIIEQANEIITEYQAQGFTLTLRQLYYQFVSRDLIRNRQSEYKRLGSVINDARLAGLIDWEAIEDRTRNLQSPSTWDEPADILKSAASAFKIDLWEGQDVRPEVWIEKDALVGVIEGVCDEFRVPYFACRGYTSQSEQWRAGQRFRGYMKRKECPFVLYLGDHDPSGIDMTRDHVDRLIMFTGFDEMPVHRLALNMEQIEQYGPPPNPTKFTDSRASGYIAKFGEESWELDALEPSVIVALIRSVLEELRDKKKWAAAVKREEAERATLAKLHGRYADVEKFLNRKGSR